MIELSYLPKCLTLKSVIAFCNGTGFYHSLLFRMLDQELFRIAVNWYRRCDLVYNLYFEIYYWILPLLEKISWPFFPTERFINYRISVESLDRDIQQVEHKNCHCSSYEYHIVPKNDWIKLSAEMFTLAKVKLHSATGLGLTTPYSFEC